MEELSTYYDQAPQIDETREERRISAEQLLEKKLGGDVKIEYGFIVPKEKDSQEKVINADIVWVRFPAPEGSDDVLPVEAKIYIPKDITVDNNKE